MGITISFCPGAALYRGETGSSGGSTLNLFRSTSRGEKLENRPHISGEYTAFWIFLQPEKNS